MATIIFYACDPLSGDKPKKPRGGYSFCVHARKTRQELERQAKRVLALLVRVRWAECVDWNDKTGHGYWPNFEIKEDNNV